MKIQLLFICFITHSTYASDRNNVNEFTPHQRSLIQRFVIRNLDGIEREIYRNPLIAEERMRHNAILDFLQGKINNQTECNEPIARERMNNQNEPSLDFVHRYSNRKANSAERNRIIRAINQENARYVSVINGLIRNNLRFTVNPTLSREEYNNHIARTQATLNEVNNLNNVDNLPRESGQRRVRLER